MSCLICNSTDNLEIFKTKNDRDIIIHRDCLKNVVCSRCNKKIRVFRTRICGYYNEDKFLCANCHDIINEIEEVPFTTVRGNYRSYGYKPSPIFHNTGGSNRYNRNELYLGIELEMGGCNSSSAVSNFCDSHAGKIFYFKSDCSIRGNGCEVVTHPCTINYHRSNKSGWSKLLDDAKRIGLRSGTDVNTGIHVHMNKSFFNNTDGKKIDLFVNSYRDIWCKIAGRSNNGYAEYHNKVHQQWGYNSSRYSSVNFENSNTIELRIFCGNMEYNNVMAILETCDAVARFVKNITYDELYEEQDIVKAKFHELLYERYCYTKDFCEAREVFK